MRTAARGATDAGSDPTEPDRVPIAIVCGLASEAKIARGRDTGLLVIVGGGDADAIRARLEAARPAAVLSFGVAGGLAPDLAPGDARAADAVLTPNGRRIATDPAWTSALAAALDLGRATIAGVETPLAGADAKATLHRATGAALVDMESHVVAEWAADHAARFAALRVVTDPAHRSLPHAATVGMRPDGGIDLRAIMASVARDPRQLPQLVRTGRDARAAFATLLRCRQRLGPRFALLDLV